MVVVICVCFLEFGVWKGESIRIWAEIIKHPEARFIGFDSFEGLKEDWEGSGLSKGHFSREGKLPKVSKNVKLIKGWFDETVPTFLTQEQEFIKIAHIDGDTYQAAKTVLELIAPRLDVGSILIFDEYLGYLGWKDGEYKAFQEVVRNNKIDYKYLGFSENSVAVKII